MNGKKLAKFRILIPILMVFLFITPANFANASQGNQMITDECLQDPDLCDDSKSSADEEQSDSADVGLGVWEYFKMLICLIFVLGLLVFVLKFINKKSSTYQQNSLVRNIGGISVGPQKSVQLLHIGDKLYIVGVGEDVQLLKEIHDEEEVQQLVQYFNEKQSFVSTKPYILELVNKLKSNKREAESTDGDQSMNSNFKSLLNKRLNEIKQTRQTELEKWKEKEKDK
ncbi:flagellar biosynthetic protein FliO [Ureibacillus galli]|nr:flagellar biosynthetic protein FliO [Ureibacillus galli]